MENRITVKYKIWLENENGDGILGDGKWELLKIIKRTGSLKQAIDEMGWGYRSTWDKLRIVEERLGFKLIDRCRGGIGGGGQTTLTEKGLLIVNYFEALHAQTNDVLQKPIEDFFKKIEQLKHIKD